MPTTQPPNAQFLAASFAHPSSHVAESLGVNLEQGLTDGAVAQMRAQYGSNALPQPKQKSKLLLFLEQFNNPLIFILFGAAALTIVVSDVGEAITIFVVVIFNAIIGFVQEQRASQRLKAVMNLTAPTARVVRNGTQLSIPAEELVVGDLVMLESGVRVPADLRLAETIELTVDESMLTGESLPVLKKANQQLPERISLGDKITMAFAGTTVRKGRAKGLVVGVGEFSEIGKISKGVAEAQDTSSPLQERLEKFGKVMAIAIAAVIGTIFTVGLLRGYETTQMLLTSIGLAVSAIPEGLPIAVTVALSIGVYQMARQKAIVRRMRAVETLGSTTVICSDKTGTLTRNQMTTVAVATDDRIYQLTGGGYQPDGNLLDDADEPITPTPGTPLFWALQIGLLCTESSFATNSDGSRELLGDPTEGAMIVAAEKARIARSILGTWASQTALPFESEQMFMVTQIDGAEGSFYLIKGSVEKVLAMCSRELRSEGEKPLEMAWIEERQKQFSHRGLRVIATAYLPIDPASPPDPTTLGGCVFAGLHGIEDPPRDEARTAIADAHNAGIKVVMITGDHVATAVSIARQLNIKTGQQVRAVPGVQLEEMSDDDLYERVNTTDVYARVAPEHKLRIVRQLQRHGHVVAMTGDGVNDAPALKQADIGVAMGSGTDVAKEASALVVQDDNFATIVSAIRYGRVMFRNLQHMVLYVLSTSTGGVLTLTAAVFLDFALPILAVQLLWINLVTDGTSTIPLAYEKEHGDTMKEQPRRRSEGLVSVKMAERILGSALIMMFGTLIVFEVVLAQYGYTALSKDISADALAYARTAAFTTLALFQIWNVHNSRALDHSIFQIGFLANRPLLAVTILALLLQVAAVQLPFMHSLMKTVPLQAETWLLCVGTSLSLIVLVEIRKWVGRFVVRVKEGHGGAAAAP
ncbi:MAG: HAD-IC family P-type ATPase [Chlorobi bacterium]|nr:MAG: cation transport ATPase [Chlorobi bacterium OLB7]MBK8912768.1 HAD-IC family P-type ATPase [Chlorobiota bacterium]MBX7218046.1 HAD-IC family P-type ATPase [Candidatus Kapabacteria bacterium]